MQSLNEKQLEAISPWNYILDQLEITSMFLSIIIPAFNEKANFRAGALKKVTEIYCPFFGPIGFSDYIS